jgi:hypothetical protein
MVRRFWKARKQLLVLINGIKAVFSRKDAKEKCI